MIKIERIPTGPLAVNTYVLYREGRDDCVIVDPGETRRVCRFLEANPLEPAGVLLTHGHFDHILGVAKLKDEYGAKVCIHAADAACLHDDDMSEASAVGLRISPCHADELFEDGDSVEMASIRFDVLATPGHTPGSVCFVVEEARALLSGDTLFRLSVGRTDLARGSDGDLLSSVLYKLYALSGDYAVYPGHMRETTLEFERKHNPYTRNYD
ncbi:MAG: MBL fold metallo-hydrolase [Clostridia bacterium]|nr:MBL fold metallo-hydrolase [Clostridia bacterium]